MSKLDYTYVAKSFYCIGSSLKKCFGCEYCRLLDGKLEHEYLTLPTQVNENFRNIPVAVNIFYGDPLLQIDKTVEYLHLLEKEKHKGPVIIITKGNFKLFPDIEFDLDLHIAFSTFGSKDHIYDGGTWNRFLSNLKSIQNRKHNYHYSIEFRPICYGINDSYNILEDVFKVASEYNLCIGYSGLQGKDDIIKIWEKEGIELNPYPGYTFGHLKPLSNEIESNIRELSKKYEVNIFHKTSCLISYVHNLDRDYNCHYYRPNEVDCTNCSMKNKCNSSKDQLRPILNIPFEYTLEYKEKHECSLKSMNLCKYPTDECSNISGYVIKIEEQLTAGDYRMIKWLTGYAVDNKFIQNENLNEKWKTK